MPTIRESTPNGVKKHELTLNDLFTGLQFKRYSEIASECDNLIAVIIASEHAEEYASIMFTGDLSGIKWENVSIKDMARAQRDFFKEQNPNSEE